MCYRPGISASFNQPIEPIQPKLRCSVSSTMLCETSTISASPFCMHLTFPQHSTPSISNRPSEGGLWHRWRRSILSGCCRSWSTLLVSCVICDPYAFQLVIALCIRPLLFTFLIQIRKSVNFSCILLIRICSNNLHDNWQKFNVSNENAFWSCSLGSWSEDEFRPNLSIF